MPRPQVPLTPSSSTDIIAREQQQLSLADMESSFILPPPALHSQTSKGATKASNKSSKMNSQVSPPPSPENRTSGSTLQRKRTLSGSHKTKVDIPPSPVQQPQTHDLPPPPSRARKIIQMKPKSSPNMSAQDNSNSAGTSNSKQTTSHSTTSTAKKAKAQPSATSAAGRKIARKTAHSIIERRRRSKMNEEFGVLKDMIPACNGVEMHKLAILQAGIEYVRYLEGCIDKLKERNEHLESFAGEVEEENVEGDMEVDSQAEIDDKFVTSPAPTESSALSEKQKREYHSRQHQGDLESSVQSASTSAANTTYASPVINPLSPSTAVYQGFERSRLLQYSILPPISTNELSAHMHPSSQTYTSSNPSSPSFPAPASASTTRTAPGMTMTPSGTLATGISPAIQAFQFSPDLTRLSTYNSTARTSVSSTGVYGSKDGKQSPHIAPLPQAALPLPSSGFRTAPGGHHGVEVNPGHAEVTATAALMMMGHDRRSSIGMNLDHHHHRDDKPSSRDNNSSNRAITQSSKSGKGMSVKDLLSS